MRNTRIVNNSEDQNTAGSRRRTRPPYYLALDALVPWWRTGRPIDWAALFGRGGDLEVEIGYGNGEALVKRAGKRPDLNLVGIELAWASTKRALRRIAKQEIGNARLLQIDARLALERLFAPRSISRAYSLFPIPWPKDRHAKRRVFSHDFLTLAGSRLVDGGHLRIVTDWFPMVEWIMEQLPGTGLNGAWTPTSARFDTKYERKWQGNGQETFYDLTLVKERHVDAPLKEDLELNAFRLDEFDPEDYRPQGQEGPITVKFREFLYDPVRRQAMVRAFVVESGLFQDVWIKIVEEEADWRVALAQSAQVVPTEGIRRALELAHRSARKTGESTD